MPRINLFTNTTDNYDDKVSIGALKNVVVEQGEESGKPVLSKTPSLSNFRANYDSKLFSGIAVKPPSQGLEWGNCILYTQPTSSFYDFTVITEASVNNGADDIRTNATTSFSSILGSFEYPQSTDANVVLYGKSASGSNFMYYEEHDGFASQPKAGSDTEFFIDAGEDVSNVVILNSDDYYVGYLPKVGRKFYVSSLGAYDTWSAARSGSMSYGQGIITAIKSFKELLWIFDSKRGEVWYNSGNVDFPYAPVPDAKFEIGTYSPNALTVTPNGVCGIFTEGGRRFVAILTSYNSFEILSNKTVEKYLNQSGVSAQDTFRVNYFALKLNGYLFISTIQASTPTLLYNFSTKTWTEWSYDENFSDPVDGDEVKLLPWLSREGASIGDSKKYIMFTEINAGRVGEVHFIQDHSNSIKVTTPSFANYETTRIYSQVVSRRIYDEGDGKTFLHRRVSASTTNIINDSTATLKLESTNDEGKNWTNHGVRSIANTSRVDWWRLGQGKNRQYRLTTNTSSDLKLVDFYVDIQKGTHEGSR